MLPALLAAFVLSPHYTPARAALIAYAVHFTTILTATIVYRASPWHPLARYPGPFIYRLSKLAFAWTASDGKQYVHLHQLHERYGDIVRIGECLRLLPCTSFLPLHGLTCSRGAYSHATWGSRSKPRGGSSMCGNAAMHRMDVDARADAMTAAR